MSRIAACIVLASLVPACITETADPDLELNEVEQEAVRGIGTVLVKTTGSNLISAYGLKATLRVRLVDLSGAPLAGMSVKALVGTTPYYATTDAEGVATIKRNFVELGVPKQHAVTWTFAGSGVYAPSSASSTFTVIRSDCQVYVASKYDAATNRQVVFASFKGRFDALAFDGIVGKPLELTRNGASVGTYITQAADTVGNYSHSDGHVDVSLVPSSNTGSLYASFDGDAYYAPCGDDYDYINVEPYGAINVSGNTTSATIGTTTVNLTINVKEMVNGLLQPRPNTKVRVYSEQVTGGDWYDPLEHYLGEVTTNSSGWASLSVPITNVVGKKSFLAATARFFGRTDAPINYEALSSEHYVTPVAKGKVRITDTLVSSSAGVYTVRWTARNAATNATIAGLELDGPCSKMVTDSLGSYTCTIDDQWHTSATVERTEAWDEVP